MKLERTGKLIHCFIRRQPLLSYRESDIGFQKDMESFQPFYIRLDASPAVVIS